MPTAQDLIGQARDAIGEGNADTDWKIVPTETAKEFDGKAPALAHNLRGSRPAGLAEEYERLNAEAVAARDDFKSTVGRANMAVFVTASLAALLLCVAGLQEWLGKTGHWLVAGVGLSGVISGGLAAMWLSRVKEGNLGGKWVNLRAKAEAKRLAYFKAIMQGAAQTPLEQLQALEYTRRFLLDNQIDYFRDRGNQHESADAAARDSATRSVFVASTLTAVAGLLSMVNPRLALIAALGVIASASAALVKSRSAMEQDRKNADRYRDAGEKLKDRKLDIDTYRERAASDDKPAVGEFFETIFIALEADHKAFLTDAEQRELAIGEMEKRLDAATDALKKKNDGKILASS